MKNSIIIDNLSFAYGRKKVISQLDLEIKSGLYGLLGRNGAGKTTLMKLIVGLLPVKDGSILINGEKISKETQKLIGYLPQNFDFYPNMKVAESLVYLGTLDNIKKNELNKRVDKLLKLVNLEKDKKKKVKNLSGGMKRRLGIAQSLLNDPKILIVDEPTAGLDPEERIRFRNILRQFAQDRIIIFSTHIASDLESTAEKIGILEKGKMIYSGPVDHLLEEGKDVTYKTNISFNEYESFRNNYLIYEEKETEKGVDVKFIHAGKPRSDFIKISTSLEAAYLMKVYESRKY